MSENIRRVVGLLQFPPGSQSNGSDAITHSFLVIGNGFQIDNAFYVKAMQLMQLSIHDYIRKRQSQRQLDEDPGTTHRVLAATIFGVASVPSCPS